MARFGHTITPIGKDKAMLFGGAVGDTGKYSSYTGKYVITGDTFICDYNYRKWKKL
jgi:protein phosphatase